MFKFTELIRDSKTLLVKLLLEQQLVNKRIDQLQRSIAQERSEDRAFLMSIITLLHKPSAVVSLPQAHDPFEELPIGSAEGYTMEELGIHGTPKVAG